MKRCTGRNGCGELKDESLFSLDKSAKDGLQTSCKDCKKEYQKEYQKENKDKISERQKEYKKEYRKENKDKISEYKKEYRKENKDKISERNKEYQKENKDKISEYQKEWSKNNKDKKIVYSHKRRALKINQLGYLPDNWLGLMKKVYGYHCAQCGSTENIHVDHVIPITTGGLHCISNLQFLCAYHNTSKSNRSSADYREIPLTATTTYL